MGQNVNFGGHSHHARWSPMSAARTHRPPGPV